MVNKKFLCLLTSGHTDDIEGAFIEKAEDKEAVFDRFEGHIRFGGGLTCFEDTKKNRNKLKKLLK